MRKSQIYSLTTLGGKTKEFMWQMREDGSIIIWRTLKSGDIENIFTQEVLAYLFYRLAELPSPLRLANNVSKLYEGTEEAGIGSIAYSYTNDISLAQATLQLVSIFVELGVLEMEENKRSTGFYLMCDFEEYLRRVDDFLMMEA
ncbi:MAG: hypothetical protein MI784_10400 [Cytophagales bacterium]|nr:hypothetical protein [Cytophagales bacterium]